MIPNLTPYEETLTFAEDEGVLVDQSYSTKEPATAIHIGEDMGVFINENAFETDVERRFAFIHEIAHCETRSFFYKRTSKAEGSRIEFKADKRTVARLVPYDVYSNTIMDGCLTEHEQAEKWNIPQWYVATVHYIYETTRWDDVQALKLAVAQRWDG